MSLADAKEISTSVAVAAVVSQLHGIFTLKEEHRTLLKAHWKRHFRFISDWLW